MTLTVPLFLRLGLALGVLPMPHVARAQVPEGHTHAPPDRGPVDRVSLDTTRWSMADTHAFLLASTGTAPAHAHGAEAPAPDHQHATPAAEQPADGAHDHAGGDAPAASAAGMAPAMTSATSLDAPMNRDGSGTAWLPATSPMESAHFGAGDWALMVHGAATLRYTAQDAFDAGGRGESAFSVPNWVMGMAQRRVGDDGLFTAKAMVSLDPLTEGGNGYPLLFQSGETFEGERLVDRQHPHELFPELSLTYAHRIGSVASVFGYLGYPGEPALGPVAFMHRPSARFMSDSPLAHHWHDATHIAFGTATLGVAAGRFKVDASLFTGAEPDEDRVAFDPPKFDSYAGRVSYSPSSRLALQASAGYLNEPEALEEGVNQVRTTASAHYGAPFGSDGDISAAFIWGANDLRPEEGSDHAAGVQHALLAEAALRVGRQAVFGRAEYTQKSAEELALEGEEFHDMVFDILSLSLGAGRDVFSAGGLTAMLGAQGTIYGVPGLLEPVYGSVPLSLQVFLRLTPSRMMHGTADAASHAGH